MNGMRGQVVRMLVRAASWVGKAKAEGMGRLLRPEVRDRWRLGRLVQYTPEQIEVVLQGALAGDVCRQWELFDLMEESWPRLAKNLAELKGALDECEWRVQPWTPRGGKASAEAVRRAGLLEDAIWHTEPDPTADENDWEATLRDLADAWGKGVSILELHWEPRRSESGVIVGLRSTHWVHPRYYGWPTAGGDTPDRLMLRVRELPEATRRELGTSADEWAPFPPDKFLVGIAKSRTSHPISAAMLRTLAWWWCASNFTGEWLLNLAQIFGVPIRWATYAQGSPKEVVDSLNDMLENMGSSAWASFPSGTTLELKEGLKTATDNPQKVMFDVADKVCDLVVLGQTLTSDVGDSGSRALGDVHQGILTGRKKALVAWVTKTLNQQFVPAFCRLNFGDVRECPYFLAGGEEEEDAKVLAERDEILLRAGAALPREWFYDRHRVPLPKENEPVIAGPPSGAPTDPAADPTDPDNPEPAAARGQLVQAKSAQEKLAENILEDLTGVEAKWLAGAKPFFRRLVALAQSKHVTDADFIEALERAQRQIPELFARLNPQAVQDALERAMGAAVVNGAVDGYLKRGGGR